MDQTKKAKRVRYAKSYGIKNNLVYGEDVYSTTFGKKNDGVLCKLIHTNDSVEEIAESEYDIHSKNRNLSANLKSGSKEITINNPSKTGKRDILGINEKLNALIFDKDDINDNIHIQIAYNVIDINKITSLHFYNIVYAINNLTRTSGIDDVIGKLNFAYDFGLYNANAAFIDRYPDCNILNHYDDFKEYINNIDDCYYQFRKYARNYYSYYPMFMNEPKFNKKLNKSENNKNELNAIKHNYGVLRVLSYVRQAIGHSDESNFNNLLSIEMDMPNDLVDFINSKFSKSLKTINKSFSENAEFNLKVISKITRKPYDDKLLTDYYSFAMIKENKNLGINSTKVRENLYALYFDQFNIGLSDNTYDKYRRKMNLIYDFIIFDYLKDKADDYVTQLRQSLTDEDKDKIYKDIAQDFFNQYKDLLIYRHEEQVSAYIIQYCNERSSQVKDRKHGTNDSSKSLLTLSIDAMLKPEDFTLFSKIIYFISEFTDKKQKNDLITALINKFDNIHTLNKLYEKFEKYGVEYQSQYRIFERSDKIANELRIIKNLAQMNAQIDNPSKQMYFDALNSLGCTDCEKEFELLMKSEDRKPFKKFIINNIIKSNRFAYIVKYTNPAIMSHYISNERLIKSILYSIPDTQLERYYLKFSDLKAEKDEQVNLIYSKLKAFNYETLAKKSGLLEDDIEKENLKSLVNLYYTVVYIAIKNLVNINSIFILAFEAFERDYSIAFDDFTNKRNKLYRKNKVLKLLERTLGFYSNYTGGKKKHNCDYLTKYYETFSSTNKAEELFKKVRDSVMHLNLILRADQYLNDIDLHLKDLKEKGIPVFYELYVYVLEREILLAEAENDKVFPVKNFNNKYKEDLLTYRSYNKDFLKILLTPLAYNLARYNNLTIRDLFYDFNE